MVDQQKIKTSVLMTDDKKQSFVNSEEKNKTEDNRLKKQEKQTNEHTGDVSIPVALKKKKKFLIK